MATIRRGEASFAAQDGTVYKIVLDFAAFAEAEEAANMQVNDLLKAMANPRLKHLGAILYGGLLEHHPEMTPRRALNLLGEGEAVGEAIAKAVEGAMPKPDASAEGKAPAQRGTGTERKRTGQAKA
jgi:hypothetical protein